MSEFIFDLQRFDSSGSGSSSGSGNSSGGSSSGGSNAKTDGNSTATATSSDGWVSYSTAEVNAFANASAALSGIVTPDTYATTVYGDNISVSGYNNNVIYNADRFDNINFTDTNLSSLAGFYEGDGYYDLIFDKGTRTRIYSTDTEFTSTFNFASGLSEIYSPAVGEWFTPLELAYATQYWSDLAYYVGTDDVYDAVWVSRGVNNLVTNTAWYDDIYLYDSSLLKGDIFDIQASSGSINFLFSNGSGTIVRYDGTFSPTFHDTSGQDFVYNSRMGAWRTFSDSVADALKYETEDNLAALEQAAFEANFNKVLDATNYTDAITVSRFESTLIYNGYSNDDLYFYDATSGNILDIGVEGDYYLNVIFDTGALARINYQSIVSPIFHLADGNNLAYNWSTEKFCDAYSGAGYYDEESDTRYFSGNDVFTISRANDSFVNKVTANDDIYLYDTTTANVTNVNVINGYAISLDFDTGANLRVQDASYISPVFHFGDGTEIAYNWINDEWAAAYETNEGVADSVDLSSTTNNFVRNAETADNVSIVDATTANIVNVHVDDNYINLLFDTGASTAVKYSNYVSPSFTFADGSQYYYNLNASEWQTPAQYAAYVSSSADLWGDAPDTADGIFIDGAISADATLSDLVAAPVDSAAVSFGTESAFDINVACGFVAASLAADSIHKDA